MVPLEQKVVKDVGRLNSNTSTTSTQIESSKTSYQTDKVTKNCPAQDIHAILYFILVGPLLISTEAVWEWPYLI